MKTFRSISTLRRFTRQAQGDYSFIWYGDHSTIYRESFTFTQPHQWRKGSRGVAGSTY
jgi:hypothetical protein